MADFTAHVRQLVWALLAIMVVFLFSYTHDNQRLWISSLLIIVVIIAVIFILSQGGGGDDERTQ